MRLNRITIEHTLYGVALALALALRLMSLGAAPLVESEAVWANQSLALARGETLSTLAPQPGYLIVTAGLFSLFGSSEAAARLWAAVIGSLLVLAPLTVRPLLGIPSALVLAYGLALDPGLVAASRQAGSLMPGMVFTLFTGALWFSKHRSAAGIAAGLALLSGPAVLPGLLGILAAALLLGIPGRFLVQVREIRAAAIPAIAIFVLVGTAFFQIPAGLTAAFSAILAYLAGWVTPSGTPVFQPLAALAFYTPVAVVFGMAAVVRLVLEWRGWSQARDGAGLKVRLLLVVWFGVALLLTLVYPARQNVDLVWALVPLWALAATEISPRLPRPGASVISLVQAVIVFFLAALFVYTLAALRVLAPGDTQSTLRLVVLLGILALGGLTGVLFALGWSYEASKNGLAWGSGAALFVLMIAGLWGSTQVRPGMPQELWTPGDGPGQAALFSNTLEYLAEIQSGDRRYAEIISTVDEATLRWSLRDYTVAYSPDLPPSGLPSLVITGQGDASPRLSAAYRGQDFVWSVSAGWDGPLPADFIRWFVYRQAPVQEHSVILWARSDIFPGGVMPQETTPSLDPTFPDEDLLEDRP